MISANIFIALVMYSFFFIVYYIASAFAPAITADPGKNSYLELHVYKVGRIVARAVDAVYDNRHDTNEDHREPE